MIPTELILDLGSEAQSITTTLPVRPEIDDLIDLDQIGSLTINEIYALARYAETLPYDADLTGDDNQKAYNLLKCRSWLVTQIRLSTNRLKVFISQDY